MSLLEDASHHGLPQPWRRTPLIHSPILSKEAGCQIYLKLETLQPSGSFKSRGIGNLLLSHLTTSAKPSSSIHFYSSSGGNAGLACAHASRTLSHPCTIIVPMTTSQSIIAKLLAAGATHVHQHGASWYEADAYLQNEVIPAARQRGEDAVYVAPFDNALIWEGHASLIDEVSEQMSGEKPDAVVCSVGGGGLLCGIVQGLQRNKWRDTRVLALETQGAHSLALSLEHGTLSTLPAITSQASTLGARTVAQQAFKYAQSTDPQTSSVKSVVLSDIEAKDACVRFADAERIMVELACGVSIAMCYEDRMKEALPDLTQQSKVVIVVCGGANVSVDMLTEWRAEVEEARG